MSNVWHDIDPYSGVAVPRVIEGRPVTFTTGPGRLTLTSGEVIETTGGVATLRDTDDVPLLVDDRGDIERLLDILRKPVPEPARVKVRPLGPCMRSDSGRNSRCPDGFEVRCTECGDVSDAGGFAKDNRPMFLRTAMSQGRRHVLRVHLEAAV